MRSSSYRQWETSRRKNLDEIERAHAAVGGTKPGRRYATQQINHAYAVLLASHFQGFCRDLYDESAVHLVNAITPADLQFIVRDELNRDRKLVRGNAQPGSIGNDFNRLGIDFWTEVKAHDSRNWVRRDMLELLNEWRNAIAHQDFATKSLGGIKNLSLSHVRQWRKGCDRLALTFVEVMHQHLSRRTGSAPW